MDRRTWVKWVVRGIGLTVGGMVAIPSLLTGLSPIFHRRSGEHWVPIDGIDKFPIGATRPANVKIPQEELNPTLKEKGVFVWRPSEGETVVFSRSCTDLGCPVNWDAGSEWFFCPCHGGIFAKNGDNKAGPPKRPLYRYTNRIQSGILEIDLNSVPPMI